MQVLEFVANQYEPNVTLEVSSSPVSLTPDQQLPSKHANKKATSAAA